MDDEVNFMDDLKKYIRDGASLDPRYWVKEVGWAEEQLSLSFGTYKEKVLRSASILLFKTYVFNLVVAGAEQLELFSIKEKSEILEVLVEAMKTHGRAVDELGDVDYEKAMKLTVDYFITDTVANPDLKECFNVTP